MLRMDNQVQTVKFLYLVLKDLLKQIQDSFQRLLNKLLDFFQQVLKRVRGRFEHVEINLSV